MQLTSIYFFFFAFTIIVLFYITPSRWRWIVLLVANIYYYLTWSPEHFLFAIASVGINFYLSKRIAVENNKQQRKMFLIFGISINLFALVVFKYLNFFIENFSPILEWYTSLITILQVDIKPPIGISFYTLQMIAYLLDVHNNVQKSDTHFGRFALFATFFPLQVSGPIERAKKLLPQFSSIPDFNPTDAREGLKRVGWGVFKKLVIANRLAIYVDKIFDNPAEFYGLSIIIAVIFFAFQLYCDFSGYTDIVLGVARILGYKLTENFNNPYFSDSIQKFWNTWHISLSTWFRDYIFFPLRRSLMRTQIIPAWLVIFIPPFLTMLISGLWHGDRWNYLLWGMLHGIYLSVENLIRPHIDRFIDDRQSKLLSLSYHYFNIVTTFLLVCIGWVFFRSKTIGDAFKLLGNIKKLNWASFEIPNFSKGTDTLLEPFIFDGGLNKENFLLSIFLIIFLLGAELINKKFDLEKKFNTFAMPVRWLFYCAAVFIIIMFSADSSTQNFIYFNF